jgi:hypothetical protein
MGHLLPVHEAHQLAHEPFCPNSLISPRIKEAAATLPLRPAVNNAQLPPAGPASSTLRPDLHLDPSIFLLPAPLQLPPRRRHHRSLCSRHCHHLPCSRCCRHSYSRRVVVASAHVAPSPLLALLKKLRRSDASIRWSALPPKRPFTTTL